jgi:hypothetical protein
VIRALFAAAVTLFALSCIMHISACGVDGTHIYRGRLFVEARNCLGTTSSVDVVEGDEPPTGTECAPACLAQRRAEGGRTIYVSTMCGPYPFDFDTSGSDPACGAALAALGRDDTCLSDGGSTAPVQAISDASADRD